MTYKIIAEEISPLTRKLRKNTLFDTIVGHIKIKKLLLTGLKTKHNVVVLRDHIIQFFTR